MLTYTEAQQLIAQYACTFGEEEIDLVDADDRMLTEDIAADRDYPPFNRATMDGYAVNAHDWEEGLRNYKVQQVIFAGQSAHAELLPGACYKIMTGAPVPLSANAVIRCEDAVLHADSVSFNVDIVKQGQNIAYRGEDILQGTIAIDKGAVCTPPVISLLATLGLSRVKVKRLPKVALFTTGDEVVEPGMPVADTQIRNSNQYLLKSLLKKWMLKPHTYQHIIDDKQLLTQYLTQALNCDIVITCGGVSAGDADHLPDVLSSLGVRRLFHKVAIRPGKPIWCGQMPNGGLVFALPGNPFSCFVTFKLFVETYLKACLGIIEQPLPQLPVLNDKPKKVSLDEFFPASVSASGLVPVLFNGSGDIKSALFANALALHPMDESALTKGHLVSFMPL